MAKSSQSEVRAVVPAAPATGRGNGGLYMRVRPVLPEMLQTILDIGWMGGDIALNTRYNAASDLIDLVAGGRREFCDQPDLFYSAAFIDVARGREYEIHIPRSEAVCIHAVMASRRDGVVTQTSWATRSAEEARRPHVLRICDAPGDPDVLDASPHEGLCTTYVRLYFLDRVDDSNCGHDMRLELKTLGQRTQRVVPASLAALGRFLPIRELIVIVKFLSFTLNSKRVSNVFTINDPDRFKGWMARIKEFFVHDRGRYLSLDLLLGEGETLEVMYTPEPHTWSSAAFVTSTTRTLSFINLTNLRRTPEGRVKFTVTREASTAPHELSTHGRRIGSVLIREVSIDGRHLRKDIAMPEAIVHRS